MPILPNSIPLLTKTIKAAVGEKRDDDGSRKAPELGFVSEKAIKGQTISHSIRYAQQIAKIRWVE